jgi:hypothetical protein
MADANSWPSIKKHGLLSTSALLDLFEVAGNERRQFETEHRRCSIQIDHPVYGSAIIRDRRSMSDSGLSRCLMDDLAPRDWYRLVNQKVFFWLTTRRLKNMISAKPYRDKKHLILTIDTASLLNKYLSRGLLNSNEYRLHQTNASSTCWHRLD